MSITPRQVVDIARSKLGTPYGHQGRVDGLRLDCAGLPVLVARELGLDLSTFTAYGRLPVPHEMRAQLDAYLDRVPKSAMQIGDVAWLRFEHEPQHLAIVGDYVLGGKDYGFSLIHASNEPGRGKVVEHRLDAIWASRIVAVWRYRGLSA